ncbi:MAG: response regulator, partial [Rhodospirillaceae bacterium]|nr:response regulator [Rhodospirillaceae bacterium]
RLIFLDVFMDPMSGLDVLAAIKANVRFQDISVVMISGSEDPDIREKCIAAGAGDLLPKPVTAAALRKIVSDVMDTPGVANDHKGVSGGQ